MRHATKWHRGQSLPSLQREERKSETNPQNRSLLQYSSCSRTVSNYAWFHHILQHRSDKFIIRRFKEKILLYGSSPPTVYLSIEYDQHTITTIEMACYNLHVIFQLRLCCNNVFHTQTHIYFRPVQFRAKLSCSIIIVTSSFINKIICEINVKLARDEFARSLAARPTD